MISNDQRLRDRFVVAIDEVLPPAPWLEQRVVDAIHRVPGRPRRGLGWGRVQGSARGLRVVAGVAAGLVVLLAVAAILIGAHLRSQTVPVRPVASPSASAAEVPWNPATSPFIPATVRSAGWPAGGPVPADLSGSWQPAVHNLKTGVLYLGGYSFLIQIIGGNVVVNGSEIDFIVTSCGVERYHYSLSGNTLVLVRTTNVCGLQIPGTYTRLPAA
jgi:hypothetical protein